MNQPDRADAFRRMHQRESGSILVLPNAWDALSARVIEDAGAAAVATTSAGVSWALGRPDGHGATRDEMIAAVRRIVRAVGVPVTADVESGYGAGTPADVAETVRVLIGAGAVGLNLEDTPADEDAGLLPIERQAERIAAGKSAAAAEGADVFLNLRIDVYLAQFGPPESRLDETVRRARAYVEAGADGVFVPGVRDPAIVRKLAAAVPAPLNVMAGPGAPTIAELQALGVARVSLGPALTRAMMAYVRRCAQEVLRDGTYTSLEGGVEYAHANRLFAREAEAVYG